MDDGLVQALLQEFARREFGQVLGKVDAVAVEIEVFHPFGLLSRAEDKADGLFLSWLAFVTVQPVEI